MDLGKLKKHLYSLHDVKPLCHSLQTEHIMRSFVRWKDGLVKIS